MDETKNPRKRRRSSLSSTRAVYGGSVIGGNTRYDDEPSNAEVEAIMNRLSKGDFSKDDYKRIVSKHEPLGGHLYDNTRHRMRIEARKWAWERVKEELRGDADLRQEMKAELRGDVKFIEEVKAELRADAEFREEVKAELRAEAGQLTYPIRVSSRPT